MSRTEDQDEQFHRAYIYWTLTDRLALSAEYILEKFDRTFSESADPSVPSEITTHRVPLAVSYYQPNGFFAKVIANYIDQEVDFPGTGESAGDDQFWVVDALVGFRLSKRRGIVSAGVKNLFDEEFRFQNTDFQSGEPRIPLFVPDRIFFARFTLSF